ncbi:MAG: aminoglycoside phosphotransferase family protein [Lapillicoccus sp.]
MLVEPRDLTSDDVLAVVVEHWDARARHCGFVPRGAGAQHWVVGGRHLPRWFITADDVSSVGRLDELQDAYAGARDLATGLAGVVPTVAPRGGGVGVVVGRWLVTVAAYIEGEPGPGDYADDDQRALVARVLGALHASPPPQRALAWRPGPPSRTELERLFATVDGPQWSGGPFSESVRIALRDNLAQFQSLLGRYDRLAALALARRDAWVPTHGEPHTANVLWAAGGPVLVDWESLRVAPRERDLGAVLRDADGAEPLSAYVAMGGTVDLDADMVELFDLEWWLWETALYAVQFHGRHTGDADEERFHRAFLDEVVPAARRL